jgi:hypothetical protein
MQLEMTTQISVTVSLLLDLNLPHAPRTPNFNFGVYGGVKSGGTTRPVAAILAGVMNEQHRGAGRFGDPVARAYYDAHLGAAVLVDCRASRQRIDYDQGNREAARSGCFLNRLDEPVNVFCARKINSVLHDGVRHIVNRMRLAVRTDPKPEPRHAFARDVHDQTRRTRTSQQLFSGSNMHAEINCQRTLAA